ncbi:hypothetical protein HYH02_011397 [Chlamydomonas schloesseri]|uniref:Uncharacterized protein n=1 Tax=Chlamydomonas schloesseri TaxID=2026947 RepID=A0A835W672_9CHLO|nr:hypothetical protein HYH02_011397 [Chlamydomonas schloesseri]|eukprot:KAG2437141.1 hypothetical protein HYH02_011397 [Chlamydomonas schloesseri]
MSESGGAIASALANAAGRWLSLLPLLLLLVGPLAAYAAMWLLRERRTRRALQQQQQALRPCAAIKQQQQQQAQKQQQQQQETAVPEAGGGAVKAVGATARPWARPTGGSRNFVPVTTPAGDDAPDASTNADDEDDDGSEPELLRWRRFDPCAYMPGLPARWRLLLGLFRHTVVCRPSNDASLGLRGWREGRLARWELTFPVLTVFDAPGQAVPGEGFHEWPLFDIFKIPLSGLVSWEDYLGRGLPHAERRKVRQRTKLYGSFESRGLLHCEVVCLGPPTPPTSPPPQQQHHQQQQQQQQTQQQTQQHHQGAARQGGEQEAVELSPAAVAAAAAATAAAAAGERIAGSSSSSNDQLTTRALRPPHVSGGSPGSPAARSLVDELWRLYEATGRRNGFTEVTRQQFAQLLEQAPGVKVIVIREGRRPAPPPPRPPPLPGGRLDGTCSSSSFTPSSTSTSSSSAAEGPAAATGPAAAAATGPAAAAAAAAAFEAVGGAAAAAARPAAVLAFGVLLPQRNSLQLLYAGLDYEQPLVRQSNAYFQIVFVALQLALDHNRRVAEAAVASAAEAAASGGDGSSSGSSSSGMKAEATAMAAAVAAGPLSPFSSAAVASEPQQLRDQRGTVAAAQRPTAVAGGQEEELQPQPQLPPPQLQPQPPPQPPPPQPQPQQQQQQQQPPPQQQQQLRPFDWLDLGPGHRFVKTHLGAVPQPLSLYLRGIGPLGHALGGRLLGRHLDARRLLTDP